jgi:hypothetical protein
LIRSIGLVRTNGSRTSARTTSFSSYIFSFDFPIIIIANIEFYSPAFKLLNVERIQVNMKPNSKVSIHLKLKHETYQRTISIG